MSEDVKSELASAIQPHLRDQISRLVDQTQQLDDGTRTTNQILERLMEDAEYKQIIAELLKPHGGDSIDAANAQGFINKPSGPVSQFYGAVSQIYVNGAIDPKSLIEYIRPSTALGNRVIYQYKEQFAYALRTTPLPKYNFPLTFRLITAAGTPTAADSGLPVTQLPELVQMSRFLMLRGPAGSGKSTVMRQLAEQLMHNDYAGVVPIYLQLGRLAQETLRAPANAPTEEAAEQHIVPLLGASIVPLGLADLKRLSDQVKAMDDGRMLIMADGLNEVYGEEAARFIMKQLNTYVAQSLSTYALVSDRVTPRDDIGTWQQARIERLAPEVVSAHFRNAGIDTVYNDLSETERTLLQTPYFLAYALDHNTPRLSSAAEAIAAFFNQLELAEGVLDSLARAAFRAYKDHHSYRFDVQPFASAVGTETYGALVSEGVIVAIPLETQARPDNQPAQEQAQFDHPLKHDYLAARYLSQHTEDWIPKTLDVVSFESNSFDALAMTLELLPDGALADTFIERVHNWNWAAALVCVAKAMRTGSGRHSLEIQMAVLSLLAEKLFDPVQQTRQRANNVLALFPAAIAAPYTRVQNLDEAFALAQKEARSETQRKGREPWFSAWCELFIHPNDAPLSELDLKNIVHPQGIIGWTAANVFRRRKLSDLDIRQLRAYFDACIICDPNDWQASTVRSRVVHAMGATDTPAAVDLLFDALNRDRYAWSRIGSARSLVEIAALTADEALRQRVITTLIDLVKNADSRVLALKTLREIGYSAFYRNAYGNWQAAMTPLIELMRGDAQQPTPEQEWWSDLLAQFKEFCNQPLTRTV